MRRRLRGREGGHCSAFYGRFLSCLQIILHVHSSLESQGSEMIFGSPLFKPHPSKHLILKRGEDIICAPGYYGSSALWPSEVNATFPAVRKCWSLNPSAHRAFSLFLPKTQLPGQVTGHRNLTQWLFTGEETILHLLKDVLSHSQDRAVQDLNTLEK